MIKKSIMEENTPKCPLFQGISLNLYIFHQHIKSNPMPCDQKTNSSKMTLYKHHCVNVLFSEHIFYYQVNCFTHLMI